MTPAFIFVEICEIDFHKASVVVVFICNPDFSMVESTHPYGVSKFDLSICNQKRHILRDEANLSKNCFYFCEN